MSSYKTYFLNPLFTKYFSFTGCATRKEYWMFVWYSFLTGVAIGILVHFFPTLAFLSVFLNLALAIPSLAILSRRLRDAGISPYWLFIGLIPLIGGICLLIMSLQPSEEEVA